MSDKFYHLLKVLLVVAVCLTAGAYMHKCQSPPHSGYAGEECVVDTVTVYDTIVYAQPSPSRSLTLGMKTITIPVPAQWLHTDTEELPDIRTDTAVETSADVIAYTPDSLTLQLPITQNVYEGNDYKAYVSGIYPSLDSVFVFPRREVITIKKPPNRWHIGPTIGFGMTPQGFQPFIGVSATFSLFSF